jgi:hypothetical protein
VVSLFANQARAQFLAGSADPKKSPPPVLSTNDEAYCTVKGEALSFMAPGTRKMAGLLARLAAASKPMKNVFQNRERAATYRAVVPLATNDQQAFYLRSNMGLEMLNAGETAKALAEFESLEPLLAKLPEGERPRFEAELRTWRAMGYLRLGEQENCQFSHNADSCLMPISNGGIHRIQRGSRQAIPLFEEELRLVPEDLKCRWLLNIAYMTLGEYPDKVPSQWLISPDVFKSEYDIKRFPDIAEEVGLAVENHAGGTVLEDFDADGDLDVMTSDSALDGPMHYIRNNGDGTFTDRTIEAGISGLVGGLNLLQGDFNNDGLPDVLVLRGAWMGESGRHPDSLLRNDGNGHFTDVTEEAGLFALHPNQTAVWFDFDGDGHLDLFFGYESAGKEIHPCELYRNNGNGTFTECAQAAGVAAVGFVKAVTTGDFNNDGRPDLYLSRRGQPNILFRNDGPQNAAGGEKKGAWKFTDVTEQAGVSGPLMSFPAWFFDYDNDGWEDIFVCGYSTKDVGDIAADYLGQPNSGERPRLYHNNHDGTFSDVTEAAHLNHVILAMGANFGDFDNDGWLDMFFGTGDPSLTTLVPDRAFRNAGGKVFQDVTTSGGFGHLQKGHGVSFGDLNNDGTQDIYHGIGGAYQGDFYRNALFENPGHGNHWVTFKLEGTKSNRAAMGARIKVVVKTAAGEREIHRTVGTGGSFGASPLRQEIGLGNAESIARVEIRWPATGVTQVVTNVKLDHFHKIREGVETAELWNLRSFKFVKRTPDSRMHEHAMR